MPLNKLLEEISAFAASAGVPLRWTEIDGDPAALLRFPREFSHRQLVLESLELREDMVLVVGRTGDAVEAFSEPEQQAERAKAGDRVR
jgi:hypothetical protein